MKDSASVWLLKRAKDETIQLLELKTVLDFLHQNNLKALI